MTGETAFRQVIVEITNRLRSDPAIARIVLFGSCANGDPGPDSDIDMLVVMRSNDPPIDRAVAVRKRVYDPERRVPFSPIVCTQEEIDARVAKGDDFILGIIQSGEVLYDANAS